MGPYMASQEIKNSEFVRWRVGNEYEICRGIDVAGADAIKRQPRLTRLVQSTHEFREKMARRCVRWLLGREAQVALDEGLFRSRGEIHRWMYDRYSLKRLCSERGFEAFQVCTAFESYIENFTDYGLDAVQGQIRKPDSLFVECKKPQQADQAAETKAA